MGDFGEDAVSDQNIDLEDNSCENMVEMVNMSPMLNVPGNYGEKHQLKFNPSKFQKWSKYVLFYFSVIVIQISGEFYTIVVVRDPSMDTGQ